MHMDILIPWLFDAQTTERIATAVRTRYKFLPFWYTLFAGNALASEVPFSKQSRAPPLRPLWWEFPNDTEVEKQTTLWLVGSALLVAPVVEQGKTKRAVYLPRDTKWYDVLDQ